MVAQGGGVVLMREVPLYRTYSESCRSEVPKEFWDMISAIMSQGSRLLSPNNHCVPMMYSKRHLPDIEQWSRAVAPTSSRGGLVLA